MSFDTQTFFSVLQKHRFFMSGSVFLRWWIGNYNGLPVCVYRVRVNRYVIDLV